MNEPLQKPLDSLPAKREAGKRAAFRWIAALAILVLLAIGIGGATRRTTPTLKVSSAPSAARNGGDADERAAVVTTPAPSRPTDESYQPQKSTAPARLLKTPASLAAKAGDTGETSRSDNKNSDDSDSSDAHSEPSADANRK